MAPLIECVPNFSEGRDSARLDAMVAAMLAVPGVYLLDREMDADHHRSVVTLAGAPEAVAEAAIRGVGRAAELIDLRRHQGAHPRLGAADVVPFVPLAETTLEDCVRLARGVGEEIWRRWRVPVYFYEAASLRPERRNLEDVRRGQFEGRREAVLRDPELRPDVGGPELHASAGAAIVGARRFLIAYNINLDTSDVGVAQAVARRVRASGGGLAAVKAMGVELKAKGRAQVSMNLTDFAATSLATVWNAVAAAAAEHGAAPAESELIGLAPRAALEGAAAEMLRFASFSADQVLENRLQRVMAEAPSRYAGELEPFLRSLAAPTPAPGGGSAAAAAGAMAAALGEMVAGLGAPREAGAEVAERLARLKDEFATVRAEFQRLADRDAQAYTAVVAARRLPRGHPTEAATRERAVAAALEMAAETPLATAVAAARMGEKLRELGARAKAATASDQSTAAALARAAREGALANVRANLDAMAADSPGRQRLERELARLAEVK